MRADDDVRTARAKAPQVVVVENAPRVDPGVTHDDAGVLCQAVERTQDRVVLGDRGGHARTRPH